MSQRVCDANQYNKKKKFTFQNIHDCKYWFSELTRCFSVHKHETLAQIKRVQKDWLDQKGNIRSREQKNKVRGSQNHQYLHAHPRCRTLQGLSIYLVKNYNILVPTLSNANTEGLTWSKALISKVQARQAWISGSGTVWLVLVIIKSERKLASGSILLPYDHSKLLFPWQLYRKALTIHWICSLGMLGFQSEYRLNFLLNRWLIVSCIISSLFCQRICHQHGLWIQLRYGRMNLLRHLMFGSIDLAVIATLSFI